MLDIEELSDGDFLLYIAYILEKLNSLKYKVYSRNIPDYLEFQSPCICDSLGILIEAIKRLKPKFYEENTSIMFKKVEDYLKSKGSAR